jgi:hypothetical protein
MTLYDFIKKYQGKIKGYPTDNQFFGECLSSVKLYIKEVFGIDPPPSGVNAAYGYWTNFPDPLGQVFKKTQSPKRGDIVIWGTGVGVSGHIAIFLEKTSGGFNSFDQNWGGKWGHIQSHNFSNILGYLTPKGGSMTDKEIIEKVWADPSTLIFAGKHDDQNRFAFLLLTGRWNYPGNKVKVLDDTFLKDKTINPEFILKQAKELSDKNAELIKKYYDLDKIWLKKYELLQDDMANEINEIQQQLTQIEKQTDGEINYWKGEYEKTLKDLKACKNASVGQGNIPKDKSVFIKIFEKFIGLFKKE